MTRLVITPLAERDIESIADYISHDNPARALTFITELREQCARIAGNPMGYRKRPELGKALHSCSFGNCVLFFEATARQVTILRVLHSARDIPAHLGSKHE
ncbi:MAG TPA: type II toxin-antitoxin system RelE/ParE family toxin [Burkholderiaceae bacterium]|nr:type II toxin-antitoxin system RelE/ParE family toxin [Burkholderiaceae bacterium]